MMIYLHMLTLINFRLMVTMVAEFCQLVTGPKVVPKGEENCFQGLAFVLTGALECLGREAAADLVKR